MTRTPIAERKLPDYTRAQEKANMITHIIGAVMGIAVMILGIAKAVRSNSVMSLISAIIFGISMTTLYIVSATYHGLTDSKGKRIMQVIDHCTIYILILGTYLPIIFSGLYPYSHKAAWLILAGELALAAVGTVFTAIDHNKYKILSMICYICMGWLIVCALHDVIMAISLKGFLWLVAGGIVYTLGAVLYGVGKKKSIYHTIFHILTLIASALQAVCILCYVL